MRLAAIFLAMMFYFGRTLLEGIIWEFFFYTDRLSIVLCGFMTYEERFCWELVDYFFTSCSLLPTYPLVTAGLGCVDIFPKFDRIYKLKF
jgi:hypothetical protein